MLSIGSAAAQGAAPQRSETKGATAAPSPRVINAAHEFEAQMMKELLKPLTENDGLTGEEDAGLGSAGALGEFASEALGRAISDQGGLGIASHIVQNLSDRCEGHLSGKAPSR
jgi:Rod binding domain-containing protein